MSDEIKKMDVAEFREMGLLQEVNRQFFHPLGLALEVIVGADGSERFGGIWDYRDDPEGMLFGKVDRELCAIAQRFQSKQHKTRRETVGFVVQCPE